jgi:hypothetical protein
MWLFVPIGMGLFAACNEKSGPTSPSTASASQPSACSFTVSDPSNATISSSGGEFSVSVTTSTGCSWTASSSAVFVTAVGPSSGTGSGSVQFSVQPNLLTPRQGSVIVAGKSLAVVQDGPQQQVCEWSVYPKAAAAPAGGSELKVEVTSTSGGDCAWTAASHDGFMNVRAGSGIGDGSALLQVIANTDPAARVGTATVAGQIVTVLQESSAPSDCAFTVTSNSTTVPAAGGIVAVTVTKTQGVNCPWIAESQASFLVAQGVVGLNSGMRFIDVPPNGFTARSGTVVIAGHSLTITQLASTVPCVFSINPTQITAPSVAAGTTFTLMKTHGNFCPWTVESQSPFITVVSKSTGSNETTVYLQIGPNYGDSRTGTVTAGGQTFTVVQSAPSPALPTGPCNYRLEPSSINFGAAVLSSPVYLTTTSGSGENCPWNAQASAPFITVDRPTGIVNNLNPMNIVFVAANTGAARSGTVTFAPGVVLNVTQAAALPSTAAAVITLESDTGDSMLHGQSRSITLVGAQLETLLDPGQGGLTLNTSFATTPRLQVRFAAPTGQSLASGYYDHAHRSQSSSQPGLAVDYNGSACDLTGRFQISEASFGAGGVVNRFHARFEQHCGNSSAALRGEVWIDAAGSLTPPSLAPFPPAPIPPTTFFSFESDPGDVVGQGQRGTYTLANAVLTPRYVTGEPEVTINLQPSIGSWSLRFRAPSGQFLTPGTYDPAGDPAAAGTALLRVTGPGSCSTLTGKFTVLEAVYGTNGDVYRFRATFETRCGASSAKLRGEIYVVADPWR